MSCCRHAYLLAEVWHVKAESHEKDHVKEMQGFLVIKI